MTVFPRLLRVADFERTHLDALTDVDRWLVIHIGAAQAVGEAMSLKQLYLRAIASKATVRRRLDRLISMELIAESPDVQDLRTVRLGVTAKGLEMFSSYEDFWCDHCRHNGI